MMITCDVDRDGTLVDELVIQVHHGEVEHRDHQDSPAHMMSVSNQHQSIVFVCTMHHMRIDLIHVSVRCVILVL
jgi:hypothetical protein